MIRRVRALLAFGLLVAACAQLSCKVNDYCLQCEKGDGGHNDGPVGDGSFDDTHCPNPTPEICDGMDNDCDGHIDEGTLPQVGDACGTGLGACAGATLECVPMTAGDPSTDMLKCNKAPGPETCNGIDDNCNGAVDEGDPGGGARCGNGTGTCVQGVEHCVNGAIACTGGTGPTTEVCDGFDNDCNGTIDNGLSNMGACGAPEPGCASPPCGICQLGTLACVGGHAQCMNAINPGFESCNNMDDDCDGSTDETFDKPNDPLNCGAQNDPNACGHVCGGNLGNGGNANWGCTAGACVITSCKAGYHDNNNNPADGCEFGPCFSSGAEVCDGVDNDCDGMIDETAAIGTPPGICANKGECAGTVATCPCHDTPDAVGCTNPGGWECHYGATVSTDANGNIIPETLCDGKDNDCNGFIDDNQPQLRHADGTSPPVVACHDNGVGACQGSGQYVCGDQVVPAQDPNGPAVCKIMTPGASPSAEKCNDKDDDCDGVTDEGNAAGALGGQTWVDVGGGHQMMQYEASLPLASSTVQGTGTARTANTETITATGATEAGTTATFTTNNAHGFRVGQRVTIAGVGVAGYNGTFTITATTATTFAVTLGTSGLAASGDGTATASCTFNITATGASETGSTATFTTSSVHGLYVGKVVTISGVGVAGYNGNWVVTGVPSTTTLTVTLTATGLAASGGGTVATNCGSTCSRGTVIPWTNVTYVQALAACQAVGATLCSESQWHRACSAVSSTTYPLPVSGTGTVIEAEDYYSLSNAVSGGTTRTWVEDETPGFFGTSALSALPNTGANLSSTNAPAQGPRLDYLINFTATSANYHVCVHMFSPTSNDNRVYVGVNTTLPGTAIATGLSNGTVGAWQWISSPAINVPAIGNRYVSLYMGMDGTKVDALYVVTGNCPGTITDNNGPGGKWSYSSAPNTYVGTTCNGQDRDATQDAAIPTGSAMQCFANFGGSGPFDMSGNVKEWALAHVPGENPIRGGSYTSTGIGIDCPLDFTLADDSFFFPDVGFRCCR